MTNDQFKALVLLCNAIVETVEESGELGAPSGVLFAALSAHGCSLDNFQRITAALVEAGALRREGDLFIYGKGW